MSGRYRAGARCPSCGSLNDGQTGIFGATTPQAGSISICAYCATVGVFTDDDIRRATDDELRDIMTDERVRRALVAIAAFIALRGRSATRRE